MSLRGSTVIALALATPVSAAAAEPADQKSELYVLSGTCTAFKIDDTDDTSRCQDKLVSFTLPNGRVGFIFAFGKMMATFSGNGADQTRLPDGHVSQPIDALRLVDTDKDPGKVESISSTGACVYGNPFAGVTTVSCAVTARQGVFRAEFVTDGTPPYTSSG